MNKLITSSYVYLFIQFFFPEILLALDCYGEAAREKEDKTFYLDSLLLLYEERPYILCCIHELQLF